MNNATTMATPHLLMKLVKQNMAKTSFKLPASDSCGEVCEADYLVNEQKVRVMTGYSPKLCKLFKFLARRCCEDKPIILAGDFNVNVKIITMPNLYSS
jgi:hypothetical protein